MSSRPRPAARGALSDAELRWCATHRKDYCFDVGGRNVRPAQIARELLAARRALRRIRDRVTFAVIAKTVAGPVGYEVLETAAKALSPTEPQEREMRREMPPLDRIKGEAERSRKWHERQRPKATTPMVAVRLDDLALLVALADAVHEHWTSDMALPVWLAYDALTTTPPRKGEPS